MEKWWDIWAAGVDIFTTCIQHGLSGSVSGLGWSPFASLCHQTHLRLWIQDFQRRGERRKAEAKRKNKRHLDPCFVYPCETSVQGHKAYHYN